MEDTDRDSGEREWIKKTNGYLSSLVADSARLIRSRHTFASYARRIPPMVNSGIIQFARDFPVYGLPDELAVRELRERDGEKPSKGLFLLVPEDWLMRAELTRDARQQGIAEITEKLIATVDIHDNHIREGGEVYTREQIPDEDLTQMGIKLYSFSVDDARIS